MDALKNRPLFSAALAFAAGIMLSVVFERFAILFVIPFSLLALLCFRRGGALLGALCIVAASSIFTCQLALTPYLNPAPLPEGGAQGRVVQADFYTGASKQGTTLILDSLSFPGGRLHGRARVQLPVVFDVHLGQRVRVGEGAWHAVDKANLGLWGQGIFYTLSTDTAVVTDERVSLAGRMEDFRNHAASVLDRTCKDASPLLRGLLLGQRTGIESGTNQAFRDAGVAHLLSVSGLHVGFIAVAVSALLALLHTPARIRLPVEAAALVGYSILSGGSPSVWRSSWMFLLMRFGRDTGRRVDLLTIWGAALLALLIINPLQLLDVGFQLSFASVLGIALYAAPMRRALKKWPSWLSSSVSTMLAAQLGVLGLTAYYYGRISLVGLVANLLAIPLSGMVLLSGLLTLCAGLVYLPLGMLLGWVSRGLGYALTLLVHGAAALPLAAVDVPRPGAAGLVLSGVAALMLTPYCTLPKRAKWMITAACGLLSMLLWTWRIA